VELELDESLDAAGGVLLLDELELGLEDDPALGVVTDPDMELEDDGGVPEPAEDEDEDGLEGVLLEDDEPAEDLSAGRDAPGPLALLSQP
jgi:hypothetical protein